MKYDVFISYSHAADSKLAPSIQLALQKLTKPWYKLSALKIFRDETDLSAAPQLWSKIEQSLKESEYFILLASPESAKSKWVAKEIDCWLANNSKDKFLIGLTEGKIFWDEHANDFDWKKSDAVPLALKKIFIEEPFIIDFISYKNKIDLSLRNPDFKDNIARFTATIQKTTANKIIGKDYQEYKKTKRVIKLTIFVLLGLLCLLSFFYRDAQIKEKQAIKQQNLVIQKNKELVADDLANKSQSALKDGSRNVAFRLAEFALEFIDSTNQKAFQALYDSYYFNLDQGNKKSNPLSEYLNLGNKLTESSARVINGSNSDISSLIFFNDGKKLIAASKNTITVVDVKTGKILLKKKIALSGYYESDYLEISGIAISKNDSLIAIVTNNPVEASFFILNSSNCEIIRKVNIEEHQQDASYGSHPNCISFSRDGHFILAGMDNNSVLIFNALDYSYAGALSNDINSSPSSSIIDHQGVNTINFSPDGGQFIISSSDNTAQIYNAQTFDHIKTLEGHEGRLKGITGATYSPKGDFIATAGKDNTIKLWDAKTFELIQTIIGSRKDIFHGFASLSISIDGKYLASFSSESILEIYSVEKNEKVLTYNGNKYNSDTRPQGIVFSPSSNYFAFIDTDSTAKLFYFDGSWQSVVKKTYSTYDTLKVINDEDADKYDLINSLYSANLSASNLISKVESDPLFYSINHGKKKLRFDVINQIYILSILYREKARFLTNHELKKYTYAEAIIFFQWLKKQDASQENFDESIQEITEKLQLAN